MTWLLKLVLYFHWHNNHLLPLSFCFDWKGISNTRDSVSSDLQTPRSLSQILSYALYSIRRNSSLLNVWKWDETLSLVFDISLTRRENINPAPREDIFAASVIFQRRMIFTRFDDVYNENPWQLVEANICFLKLCPWWTNYIMTPYNNWFF